VKTVRVEPEAKQELAAAAKHVQRLESQLASEFSRKAPPELVASERERLAELRDRHQTLERRRATLARLSETSP